MTEVTHLTGPASWCGAEQASVPVSRVLRSSFEGVARWPYESGWCSVAELTLALLSGWRSVAKLTLALPSGWPHRESWQNSAGI